MDPKALGDSDPLKITILAENQPLEGTPLAGEHGLSLLVEQQGRKILFDTGASSLFLRNAQSLGLGAALADLDAVVLSHGHYDHGNGLVPFRAHNATTLLYMHSGALTCRYSTTGQAPHSIALSAAVATDIREHPDRVRFVDEPVAISDTISLTGTVPRGNQFEQPPPSQFLDTECTLPDPVRDDIALYARTSAGVVLATGCAHAGIVNIMDYVAELTGESRIHAVIGGLHLGTAPPDRIAGTIAAFDHYRVACIAPYRVRRRHSHDLLRTKNRRDTHADCSQCTGRNA